MRVQTNGMPAPFVLFFFGQFMVAFVFFGSLDRSYLSDKNKNPSKGQSFHFVGLVRDEHRVKKCRKIRIQIRT